MKNWDELFGNLSDEEKNKIALLRVIECSNGVVQHMFRANDEDALSIEETRDAMKFSMGCMKTMSIPLKSHTVTFAEETASVMHEVREIYISGFKNGNQEDLESAKLEEELLVRSFVKSVSKTSFFMNQIITREDDVIVEAQVHLVFIDENGKPVKIPELIFDKFLVSNCRSNKATQLTCFLAQYPAVLLQLQALRRRWRRSRLWHRRRLSRRRPRRP